MPFWVPLYVLVMIGGAIAGLFIERRVRSWALVLLDLAVSMALILFVLAYYAPGLIDSWGRANAALYAAALVGVGVSHQWEMRAISQIQDPEMSEREHAWGLRIGILVSLALYIPGLGLGVLVALRTW
jgi:hypothetical protein